MPEPLPQGSESLRIRAVRRRRRQDRTAIVLLLLLAVAVFSGGITWGLPSRDSDKYLFGNRPVWSGKEILALTGNRAGDDAHLGADVDRDPLLAGDRKVVLNQTDAQRAEIVRRYRLYTYQPDEMVTMMALAQMRPGEFDFDPRLYQYGGAWVYPIGGLLKICSILRIVPLTPDLAYYLDNPRAFGRFYVIARLYVVAWAIVGAWAVFALTRRLTRGSMLAACIACFAYVMMPVVVNMSHEAKPHLPGAVLMLLSVLAAIRYVRTAEAMWWLLASALAGLAVGMVLAAWPVLIVLPLATLLVRQEWPSRLKTCGRGMGFSVVVYFATNPYVFIHLFDTRELLRSNLGNTRAMFDLGFSLPSLVNAAKLIAEGASPVLAGTGLASALVLIVAALLRRAWAVRHSGWLLLAPAAVGLVQFVLFAGGQPAEYGRFAVFVDITLMIAAVVGGYLVFEWMEWRPEILVVLGLAAAIPGSRYYAGFVSDAFSPTSRTNAAQIVEAHHKAAAKSVGVFAEPAPYSVPPPNLFDWPVVLLPKNYDPQWDGDPPDVIVRAVDELVPPGEPWRSQYNWNFVNPVGDIAPMRWAGKPFLVMSKVSKP
jgi:hypothetical protein